MEVSPGNQFALVVSKSPATSFQGLLDSQKELLRSQIDQLQNIVVKQCNLTGVNPLSQEMAAGALSIKIGKRPRDLLNPKAIKYMQSVFSIKDEISKKDSRAISALFGVTATQVRDFFNVQRSRVRRFIRLSREQTTKSNACIEAPDGPSCSDSSMPIQSVPLNSLGPTTIDGSSCSSQDEVLPGTDELDKYFMANIFSLMRKEESFAGQVTLLEWILQIQNSSVLYWFLTKGGVMILATWLSQAAIEEQTSFLHVSLRVLCHLPLHRALPAQMSAILQSVNKLRFYRKSDISNRAKNLLSRWSKIFARSQVARKPNASVSPADAQDEMLLKQSIGEIMGNELCESKIDILGGTQSLLTENFDVSRNLGSSQAMKLLTSASEDSKKLLRGVSSSQTRERRKVQLVEQPGQRLPARSSQVSRSSTATQARPLSTDDIQKAKMRAQFMQSKYGKRTPSDGSSQVKGIGLNKSSSNQASTTHPASKIPVQPKVEEQKKPMKPLARISGQQDSPNDKAGLESEEPLWKKCRRVHVPWVTPPEFTIKKEWHVCAGDNSKEAGIQNNRMRREKGVTYNTPLEIPANPKDPWDQEIDYDDTLTPEISTETLPENDATVPTSPAEPAESPAPVLARENPEPAVTNAVTNDTNMSAAATPDLELLGVLLRYPEVVVALTSGQAGNLSNEQMVQLLDTIKAKGVSAVGNVINGFVGRNAEEKVEVSLPSPTPSSNPVTSGWRPETAKNPFSRQQNVTVNGQGYAIPAVSFQEKLPSTSTTRYMAAPPQQQSPSLPQQQFLHPSVHEQSFPMVSRNGQSWAPDMVSSRQNIPGSNASNAPSAGFFPPAALPSLTRHQLQPQQPAIPDARISATQMQYQKPVFSNPRTWTGRLDSASSNVRSPAYSHNYNYSTYDGGDSDQAPWQRGPSHGRNGYYGAEPGFESWSPDNSPVRAQTGAHYLNPGMNMGHSYRPDTSRYPRNQPGFRGNGRSDNPKFQNRRR